MTATEKLHRYGRRLLRELDREIATTEKWISTAHSEDEHEGLTYYLETVQAERSRLWSVLNVVDDLTQ